MAITPAWPASLDDDDAETRRRRSRLALATVIARSRTGNYYFTLLALAYLPVAWRNTTDVIVTSSAAAICLGIGLVRRSLYRRTAQQEAAPERWRRIVGGLAASILLTWDAFVALEVWLHALDIAAMLLVAVSTVLRTGSVYTAAPDRYVREIALRWSIVPLLAALLAVGTPVSYLLFVGLILHAFYVEAQATQLNNEFWRGVVATESLARAHAQLKHEVAMREQAETELRLAQKLESIGRLAAGIAHEINSPLQAITSSLEFSGEATDRLLELAREAVAVEPPDSPRAAEVAELAQLLPESKQVADESLARVTSIVRSIRAFAHPAGVSTKASIDLNQALLTTLTIARHEYATIADVTTDLGDLPLVECYGGELNQVFLNIIVNAAHAIAATGARGAIRVASRVEPDRVRIAISDSGCGIPDDIRDRIFDPFFTTKSVGKGTGQGLAIAHAIVTKRHGGELTFESKCGEGTTFHVVIPRQAPERPST